MIEKCYSKRIIYGTIKELESVIGIGTRTKIVGNCESHLDVFISYKLTSASNMATFSSSSLITLSLSWITMREFWS